MIRRLLLLNGLAIIGVVMNHAAGATFVAMFWWADRFRPVQAPNFDQLGGPSYLGLRFVEQLIVFVIPAFLFVSGFFVAVLTGKKRDTIEWSVIRSRLVALVIPYVIWSLIIFLVDFVLLDVRYSLPRYARLLLVGGATDAYYYVPVICQLYLLSPWLVRAARANWKLLLGISLAIYLVTQAGIYLSILGWSAGGLERYLNLPGWAFPNHLIWFCGGIVAGLHTEPFKRWLGTIRPGLFAAALLLLLLGMVEWEWLFRLSGQTWLAPERVLTDGLYSAAAILCILAYDLNRGPLSKQACDLAPKSYGIYLVHSLVLIGSAKAMYHLTPQLLAVPFVTFAILAILGLGVPLLIMEATQRLPLRSYYRYLFG